MQLAEKYRPQTWDEVVGQGAAVARIRQLARRGLAGRAYWVSGLSGTGKTTIARLLAAEVAGPWGIEEIDAKGLTVADLERAEKTLNTSDLFGEGKGGRAVIVNEAHGLTKSVVTHLLNVLERIPARAMWIFTTTVSGQRQLFDDHHDAPAFLSRCALIELTTRDLEGSFAVHALKVARAEGLDSQPLDAYVQLARRCKCNLRAMLQEIDCGAMLPKEGELF
jgi:DNA polymerase-3 subunit gamma/tau